MQTRLYQIANTLPQDGNVALDEDLSDDFPGGVETNENTDNITLSGSLNFPSNPDNYFVYVKGEYMKFISKGSSTDRIIVYRGMLGTKPREHESGQDLRQGYVDPGGSGDDRELLQIDSLPINVAGGPTVKDVGEIEQTLEYRKAEFRISNTSVTINGLAKGALRDAGSIHRPWVFEIEDDAGNAVFSGIVDDDAADYDAETRNTSFDVLSWLEILDRAPAVPARDIYEARVDGVRGSEEDNPYIDNAYNDVQVRLNDRDMPSDIGVLNDVLVAEGEEAEVRERIINKAIDDNGMPVIEINGKQEGEDRTVLKTLPSPGNYVSSGFNLYTGQEQRNTWYEFTVTRRDFVRELVDFSGGDLNSLSNGETKTFELKDGYSVEAYIDGLWERTDRSGNVQESERRTYTFSFGSFPVSATANGYRATIYSEGTPPFDYDNVSDLKLQLRLKKATTSSVLDSLSAGDTVRILDQEIYGDGGFIYDLSGGREEHPEKYDIRDLIAGLFQIEGGDSTGRPQLGVLPEVFDSSSFYNENNSDDAPILDPRVELPEDPLKSLRMLQQKGRFLLQEQFVSGLTDANGDRVPGYYPSLIYREKMFDSASTVAPEKIKSWSEDVARQEIKAVVIRPNKAYLKNFGGLEADERIGFYFEGIERYETSEAEDLRNRMSPPEGNGVIEIEMPIIPSDVPGFLYSGRGDDNTAENNPKIRAAAKFFYEHFEKSGREVEFEYGEDDPTWAGGYWYFKQQGSVIDDFVFVTQEKKEVGGSSITASLKGRIGEAAGEIIEPAPTAIIRGPESFNEAEDDERVEVVLNGYDSFSLAGNGLSFYWERKEGGGTYSEVQPTKGQLRDTINGVTSRRTFFYRLTVTDDVTGKTDSTEKRIFADVNSQKPDPNPESEEYEVNTWQRNGRGFLEVIPDALTGIEKVSERSAVGANIDAGQTYSEVEKEVIPVYTVDTSNDVVVLDGHYKEEFDKDLIYLLTSSTDKRVLFDVDEAVINGDYTEIKLDESIDSTQYAAAGSQTYVTSVELDTKHTSAIEVKVVGSVQSRVTTVTKTFDFDDLAEVDVSVYMAEDGAVYADVKGDEDADEFKVEYSTDGGSSWNEDTVSNPYTDDVVGLEVLGGGNVSSGDEVRVRVTPYNVQSPNNREEGEVVIRATYYSQSTDDDEQFDSITITGAGTIDSINSDTFRFLDRDDNDAATIDVFNVDIDQINGTPIGKYARTDLSETITEPWVFDSGLYVDGEADADQEDIFNIASILGVHDGGTKRLLGSAKWDTGDSRYEYTRDTGGAFLMRLDSDPIRFAVAEGGLAENEADFQDVWLANSDGHFGLRTVPDFAFDVDGIGRFQTSTRAPRYRSEADYDSGFVGSGYAIDEDLQGKPYAMELSHLSVRGTLRVRELLLEQMRVTKGTQIISPGGGKVARVESSNHTSVTNTFDSSTQQYWYFEDPDDNATAHGMTFGDRVLAQRFDPDQEDVVEQVRAVVDSAPDTHEVKVTVDANPNYTIPNTGEETEGWEFAVVGHADANGLPDPNKDRDNLILDDPFGPRRDVLDGIVDFEDWNNRSNFLRFSHGNLDGSYGFTDPTYGMAAGNQSGAHITATDADGVRLYDGNGNLSIKFDNGRGYIEDRLQIGSDIFIGDEVLNLDSSSRLLLGMDGPLPLQKIRGPDTTGGENYVQFIARSSTTDDIMTIRQNGDRLVGVTAYEAEFFGWTATSNRLYSGSLEMHSAGRIRETNDVWRLNEDGSGRLADGDILWDQDSNLKISRNARFEAKGARAWDEPYSTTSGGGGAYERALQIVVRPDDPDNNNGGAVHVGAQMGNNGYGESGDFAVRIIVSDSSSTVSIDETASTSDSPLFDASGTESWNFISSTEARAAEGYGSGSDNYVLYIDGMTKDTEVKIEIENFSTHSTRAITAGATVVETQDTLDGDTFSASDPYVMYAGGSYTSISGGTIVTESITADEIKTNAFLTNEILANSAEISDKLKMVGSGKITDDDSPINYRISSDGIDLRANNSTRVDAREITWYDPDLTGSVRGEIYAHNYTMNINSYRFGGPSAVETSITAYDRPKTQNGKEYARIVLRGDSQGYNEIDLLVYDNNRGQVNIRNAATASGIAFDFDPYEDYLGFKNVYGYNSNPGPTPPTPTDGIRLYTKEASTNVTEPYLWFITEDGNQYKVNATQV